MERLMIYLIICIITLVTLISKYKVMLTNLLVYKIRELTWRSKRALPVGVIESYFLHKQKNDQVSHHLHLKIKDSLNRELQ